MLLAEVLTPRAVSFCGQVLTELSGLTSRLSSLLKRKGTAAEVISIFKQLPSLLTALKLVEDVGNIGDRGYESAPKYDSQVYFRMQTNNFALLAPLIRPLPKQPELLKECLETLSAALRDCPSNQVITSPVCLMNLHYVTEEFLCPRRCATARRIR